VKPTTAQGGFELATPPGGRFVARNVTVRALIREAYGVHDSQIVGGPAWMDVARFEIHAVAADRAASPRQRWQMLRTLLADRFGLRLRTESRQLPIYGLTRVRPTGAMGPRMRPAAVDCAARTAAGETFDNSALFSPVTCGRRFGNGTIIARQIPVSADHVPGPEKPSLIAFLSLFTDRPIVDRTGLTGVYDVDLEFRPEPGAIRGLAGLGAPPPPPPPPPPGALPPPPGTPPRVAAQDRPVLRTALEDQAGLRLVAQTGPVDVFTVVSLERPSPD
jgi:uncharacterized protein (TIGR03435 family)